MDTGPANSPDADCIMIPRPRSVIRAILDVVTLHTRRTMARDRHDALVDATQVLSDSGRAAHLISRDPVGDEWAVTLGPAAPSTSESA
ncbi:hypothetical protein [Amycolatopsis sp. lyj-108]|uniref:hypothetical protein n=1 Tax=Amycolatopsis sp. lyj-108 TaxID=2789286 RepID=UPI00397D13EF